MATLSKTLEIILTASDQTAGAIGGVTDQLTGIATAGQAVTQPLADATGFVLGLQQQIIQAGAALALSAAETAQQFDISFAQIATLTGKPTEDLVAFRGEILTYAQGSTQSLSQINLALYNAISAGEDYTNALALIRVAENLSIASVSSLSESQRALSQVMTSFGDEFEGAEEAAAALFGIIQNGVTTMPALSGAIGGVMDIAVAGGVSFTDLGGAIATLTRTQETSVAITGLGALINGLIKPSNQAAEAANALGIEFSAANLKATGLPGLLQQIATETGGSTDAIAELFGNKKAFTAALALMRGEGDLFVSNIEKQKNAVAPYQLAVQTMVSTMDTGKSALEVLAIAIGGPILTAYRDSKGEITNITNALSAAFEDGGPLRPIGALMEQIGVDIQGILADIAANLPGALEGVDFSGFTEQIGALWGAIQELLDLEDLRTENGLTTAIQVVVDLLTQLAAFTTGTVETFGTFKEDFKAFVVAISEIDPAKILLIGELAGYAVAANVAFGALGAALLIVKGALPALAAATPAVTTATTAASGAVAVLLAALGPVGLGAAILAAVGGYLLLEESKKKQAQITEELKDGIGPLVDEIEREAEAAKETRERIENNLLTRSQEAESIQDVSDQLLVLKKYWEGQGYEYDEATGKITRLSDAQWILAEATKEATVDLMALEVELPPLTNELPRLVDGTWKATGAFASSKTSTEGAKEALNQYVQSGKLTVDQLIKITENANDFQIKMEEIASNERIKLIDAKVTLNVAELEAQTKQAEAAFGSLDNTINSTAELLNTLYGLWAGAESQWEKDQLKEWIDGENERRDAAMELQRDLIQTQIDSIKARTDALNRGDALIRVDGDGLAPHLEAFMWEILRSIQVRASTDMQEFLLHIGSGASAPT